MAVQEGMNDGFGGEMERCCVGTGVIEGNQYEWVKTYHPEDDVVRAE